LFFSTNLNKVDTGSYEVEMKICEYFEKDPTTLTQLLRAEYSNPSPTAVLLIMDFK
jgi:hypothetical protein